MQVVDDEVQVEFRERLGRRDARGSGDGALPPPGLGEEGAGLAEEVDAEDLARLVIEAEPGLDIVIAHNAREAVDAYTGQRVLFGSPLAIAGALPSMPSVEWVQSSWAGVTPLIGLDRRDYVLTGIKGVFGRQMAEYVAGYLLAHELRIIRRYDEQRARRWWEGVSGSVTGKRIGILGTGSIGRDIARLRDQCPPDRRADHGGQRRAGRKGNRRAVTPPDQAL